MFFLYALASHRPDSVALALWSFMAVRGRWPSWHPVFSTPDPGPTEKNRADDALLFVKQRERKQVPVCWHLLFCRLFNESANRHLGLQFYNLFDCRNPTSPNVDALYLDKLFPDTSLVYHIYKQSASDFSSCKTFEETIQLDDETFVLALANLFLLVEGFDLKYETASVDLDKLRCGAYLLP
jgi:hypothetical protein